jgi:CRP-like cAMP-binding protein
MERVLLVVARDRPDVYAALVRQCAGLDDVRVVLDRRQPPTAPERQPDRRGLRVTSELASVGFAVVPAGRLPIPDAPLEIPPDRGTIVAVLHTLEVFKGFTPVEIAELAVRMGRRALVAGQVLFREGDVGNEMFFVLSGRLVISKAVAPGVDKVLTRMGPVEFFGEMNLFGGLRRSATVQAESDAEILVLDRETLTRIVDGSPRAGLAFFAAVVREFSQRLSATDDLVAEVTRWGLEATGFDLGRAREEQQHAAVPPALPDV